MSPQSNEQQDARGVPVSSCAPESLIDYETALYQFHSYFGDPTETLTATLERDPGFVMGHVFMANAMLLMSERQYLPMAKQSIDAAEALSGKSNARELALIAAARHWLEGRWDQGCVVWDQVLADHPRDALTIQCAHLTDFYLGDALNLRDRIGRIFDHWDKDIPGYSYILGMQAFGFEECNQYDRAEEAARGALDIEARDGWSVHALTHVMEMQNRYEEGQKFLRGSAQDWAPDNGFAFHNWWHLGLFHLEQEDFGVALKLYDDEIYVEDSDVSLQMLDASALLWRLHLQGIDVGDRWDAIANLWARKTEFETGYYAFNDLHATIALLGAGRVAEAEGVLKKLKSAINENSKLTAMMARDVGVPACAAMIAFAQEKYADVIEYLYPVRSIANRFGGSNAQRDILTQTLTEAAIRSGKTGLATNLLNERSMQKPTSPLTRRFKNKIAH